MTQLMIQPYLAGLRESGDDQANLIDASLGRGFPILNARCVGRNPYKARFQRQIIVFQAERL